MYLGCCGTSLSPTSPISVQIGILCVAKFILYHIKYVGIYDKISTSVVSSRWMLIKDVDEFNNLTKKLLMGKDVILCAGVKILGKLIKFTCVEL